jgi:Sortilin, neurotensin receptor 3,
MRMFLGGSKGFSLYEDGDVTQASTQRVLCLVRTVEGGVLAGTADGQVLAWSGAGGATVLAKDLGDAVTSLAIARSGRLIAGCLPVGAWRSKDAGESWTPIRSLAGSPGADSWAAGDGAGSLPAAAAAVTAVGTNHKDSKTIYVGIQVGGVYRSRDGGKSWYNLGLPCPDVHSIQLSAAKPERVFVTTGCANNGSGGAFCSDDEGISWRQMGEANRCQYTMGLAAHPTEPDRVILSAAEGAPSTWKSNAGCDLYLSTDSGRRFRTVVKDLKGGVRRRGLVINPRVPSEAAFGTTTGELWYSNDGGESFDLVAEDLGDLHAVAFA